MGLACLTALSITACGSGASVNDGFAGGSGYSSDSSMTNGFYEGDYYSEEITEFDDFDSTSE